MRLTTFTNWRDIPLSGGNTEVDLPRGQLLHSLQLRLTGAITLAAGSNTAAATQRVGPWGVIQRLQILANGTDVIREFSGAQLFHHHRFHYGGPAPFLNFGDVSTKAAGTANPTFDHTLVLPFAWPKSFRPDDTLLDTRTVNRLSMRVDWGTFTDINSSASAFTTSPSLNVTVNQVDAISIGPNGRMEDPLGSYSPLRTLRQVVTLASAGANQQITLPTGSLYRGFYIRSAASATPAVDSQLITNLRVRSGSLVFVDAGLRQIQDRYRHSAMFGSGFYPDSPDATTSGVATPVSPALFASNNNCDLDAHIWYDFPVNGQYSGGIDTRNFQELFLEVTNSAACQLEIVTHNVFPAR